jgi:signal peptidase I
LPGDRVVIKDGTVTVYNQQSPGGFNPDSGYEPKGALTILDTDVVVQPGNYFVIGDNRNPGASFDSREWGQLPSSYVIGVVKYRLLPLDSARSF